MLTVKVIRISEEAGLTAERRVTRMMRVEWMAGDYGPFVEHFPREGFDAVRARTKLEEQARELEQLTR